MPSGRISAANADTAASRASSVGAAAPSHNGASRSSRRQQAISESVSPTGWKRCGDALNRLAISAKPPLCANRCMRPPSSRMKGWVFAWVLAPIVARRTCEISRRVGSARRSMKTIHGLSPAGSGSL